MLPDAALLLQQQDSARLSIDVVILVLELLLGLLHLGDGLLQLLHGLLHRALQLLHPLGHVADVSIKLVTHTIGFFCAALQLGYLLVQVICFSLKC